MSFRLTLGFFGVGREQLRTLSNDILIRLKTPTTVSLIPIQRYNQRRLYSNETTKNNKEVLVYKGPLSRQIARVKLFTLMTSVSGLFAQPVIMTRAAELGSSTSTIVVLCSVVGFFTFVTPLLLHFVTKKYVTTVLFNTEDDSYTATTFTLFLRVKELHMKPGEGTIPDMPGMFTSISVRGIPLFIDARYFSDVYHYKRIMGFDRPIDFKLTKIEHTSSKNE